MDTACMHTTLHLAAMLGTGHLQVKAEQPAAGMVAFKATAHVGKIGLTACKLAHMNHKK